MKGIQGGSMYFYIDGFFGRGEDPRNRYMMDVYIMYIHDTHVYLYKTFWEARSECMQLLYSAGIIADIKRRAAILIVSIHLC